MLKNFLRYSLIILAVTFLSKESFALNGKDISEEISEWLLLEGVSGDPIFSKKSIYKDCLSKFQITKVFKSYKTVKIRCLDENGLNLIVRVNLKKTIKKTIKNIQNRCATANRKKEKNLHAHPGHRSREEYTKHVRNRQ